MHWSSGDCAGDHVIDNAIDIVIDNDIDNVSMIAGGRRTIFEIACNWLAVVSPALQLELSRRQEMAGPAQFSQW